MAERDFRKDLDAAKMVSEEQAVKREDEKAALKRDSVAVKKFENERKMRNAMLNSAYVLPIASAGSARRHELQRKASRELTNQEDRRYVAKALFETAQGMKLVEQKKGTGKPGTMDRAKWIGRKLLELPTAAFEGATEMAESAAGIGRGIVGKGNDANQLQYQNWLEEVFQAADPKNQTEDNLVWKSLRGAAGILPQIAVGGLAYRAGGAKLLAAEAGSQMFAPFRESLVAEGVGPVKATGLAAASSAIGGALEAIVPIPGLAKGGLSKSGGKAGVAIAKKVGAKGLAGEAIETVGKFGAGYLGEVVLEEGGQAATEKAFSLAGAAAEGNLEDRRFSEITEAALDGVRESALPMLPFSLGGGGLHIANRAGKLKAQKTIRRLAKENKAPSRRMFKTLGLPGGSGGSAANRMGTVHEAVAFWSEVDRLKGQIEAQKKIAPNEQGVVEEDAELSANLKEIRGDRIALEEKVQEFERNREADIEETKDDPQESAPEPVVSTFAKEESGALRIGEDVPQGPVAGLDDAAAEAAMESTNPEQKRRSEKADAPDRGRISQWQRIMAAAKRLGLDAVRRRKYLPTGEEYAAASDGFRQMQSIPEAALGEALGMTRDVVQPLSQIQYKLFREYLLAKGQLRSLNMEHREFLRLGFGSQEEVEARIAQLAPLVEATPEVKLALTIRNRNVRGVVERMVKEGMIGEDALDDIDGYMHQQVLFHVRIQDFDRRADFDSKSEKMSFLKGRVKDLDAQKLSAMRWVEDNREEAQRLADARVYSEKKFPEVPVPKPAALRKKWISYVRKVLKLEGGKFMEEITRLEDKGPVDLGEKHDFDTSYIAAEIDFLSRAIAAMNMQEVGGKIVAEHDRFAEFYEKAIEDSGNGANVDQIAKDAGYEVTTTKKLLGSYTTETSAIMEEYDSMMADEMGLSESETELASGKIEQRIALPNALIDQFAEEKSILRPRTPEFILKAMLDSWKAYTLMNPMRFVGYNVRNAFGDLDVALAGDPMILPYVKRAFRELKTLGTVGESELSESMRASRNTGTVGSGRYGSELSGNQSQRGLKRFAKKRKKTFGGQAGGLVSGYWNSARGATQFREDLLRHAAFLRYRDLLSKGELKHFAASQKESVLKIKDRFGIDAAASHLARNLLGDYGDLTVMGDYLRSHAMPFWAFVEINTKRYPRILQNAFKSGSNRTATGAVLAKVAVARIGAMYGMQWLWNNVAAPVIYGGEPEEELSEFDRTMGHLWFGRNPDGTARVFRGIGSLSEFLETFGVNEALSMLPKLKNGQTDVSSVVWEMAKSPPEKVADSLGPFFQAVVGAGGGMSTWPEFFGQWHNIERDRAFVNIFGFRDAYDALKGKVIGQGYRARSHWLQRWFVGVSDPRANSRGKILGLREDYLKSKGEGSYGSFPRSKYANAKQAAEAGDKDAFMEWRDAFVEVNGQAKATKRFLAFLDHLDPLFKLSPEDDRKFEFDYLDDEQREHLRISREYSQELRMIMYGWWVE